MLRSRERKTLICENVDCPRPRREFQLTIGVQDKKYCCRACFRVAYTAALAAQAKANPALTPERFDEYSPRFRMSTPLRAQARRVLVDGVLINEVVAASGCSQQNLSKVVGKYRAALKDDQCLTNGLTHEPI